MIHSDIVKAERIKDWFSKQFSGRDEPLDPFDGPPRPLDTPITTSEVEFAARRLKNGRATGPDAIPNELLKYATPIFCEKYSEILNTCFEKQEYLTCIGEGIITPLQKPNKPKGLLKSLRPLTHSNCARKI